LEIFGIDGGAEMKKARLFTICLLVFALAGSILPGSAAASSVSQVTVEIDGEIVVFSGQQPVIIEGRVLVPVRGVFEKLGYTVKWDQQRQSAELSNKDNTVIITVGELFFTTNEDTYTLAVPAQAINGRTMLPFRALLESVGCGVIWDGSRRAVLVYTGGLPEGAAGSDDGDVLEDLDVPYTLPPPEGRQVARGSRFGVDIHDSGVVFHGSFYVNGTSTAGYIDALDTYRRNLPETARVFCLLAPSYVEFLDERYSAGVAGQKAPIEHIYKRVEDKGVIPVDAYSKLAAHVKNEYLYFRTDTHWTTIGAYYAYLAFAEAAGFDPVTIDNYLEFAIPGFLGMYVSETPGRAVLNSPDTLYYYMINDGTTFSRSLFVLPGESGELSYRVFLGGDEALIDFTSSNKNGKTLVVIKESYANAFIPWAAPHYERIVVVDPRHYTGSISKYLGDCSDIDFLFLSTANTPSYPWYVDKMARVR